MVKIKPDKNKTHVVTLKDGSTLTETEIYRVATGIAVRRNKKWLFGIT